MESKAFIRSRTTFATVVVAGLGLFGSVISVAAQGLPDSFQIESPYRPWPSLSGKAPEDALKSAIDFNFLRFDISVKDAKFLAAPDPRNLSRIRDPDALRAAVSDLFRESVQQGLFSSDEQILFHFATTHRVRLQFENSAARWSPGAPSGGVHQFGTFPEGAYAGRVSPWNLDVSKADMAVAYYSKSGQQYFNGETFLVLRAPEGARQWDPYGYLNYGDLNARFPDAPMLFAHFALPFGQRDEGVINVFDAERGSDFPHLPAEVLAYGRALNPEGQPYSFDPAEESMLPGGQSQGLSRAVRSSYSNWRSSPLDLAVAE